MDKEILEILKRLESKFDGLESKFDGLENKVDENTQILRALEHSSQVNKADHDNMGNDIAHIKGDIALIKKDLTFVEEATAKNWSDITRLKAVK